MQLRKKNMFLIAQLLTALGLVLASCAPAATPANQPTAAVTIPAAKKTPEPAGPTATPTAEQPRYGGTLLLNLNADPPNLDIHSSITIFLLHPLMPVYNGILQYDPLDPDKVIGDLAEKWEVTPDAKVYTFHFQKGVKWHDGNPFTSEDAKFNLERMLDPKTRSARAEYLKSIERIEAPDQDTLKLTLKSPFNLAPLIAVGWMLMLPPQVIRAKGDMKTDVLGTGPFKLKEYASGVIWRVEKNKDYFIKDHPYLDGITTYIIRDPSARIAAFRTGKVHLTMVGSQAMTPSQVQSIVTTNPETVVHRHDALGSNGIDINHNVKPWNDVRVRKAAHLAIDRELAIKIVGEGAGITASYFPRWGVPSEELVKRPGWGQAKDADRAEAKKLLAEAGFPNGLKTRLLARSGGEYIKMAEFLQDQLRTVGIDATIDPQEATLAATWEREGKYEMYSRPHGRNLYDPYDIGQKCLTGAGPSGVSGGVWGYGSAKYDELFARQGGTLDQAERKKIVREMDEILLEEVPTIIYMWREARVLASPKVRNYKPGVGMFNNFRSQDVWLAQ